MTTVIIAPPSQHLSCPTLGAQGRVLLPTSPGILQWVASVASSLGARVPRPWLSPPAGSRVYLFLVTAIAMTTE